MRGTPSLSRTMAWQSGQHGTRKGSPVLSSRKSLPRAAAQRSTTAGCQRKDSLARSRLITAKERCVADRAQSLEVRDGGDDGGMGAGHGLLDLALPLAHHRCGGHKTRILLKPAMCAAAVCDKGLSGSHFADDGGAAVGPEGEGCAPDGVGLRSERCAQELGQAVSVIGRPVEGRVGLDHPSGDRVAVLSMNSARFTVESPEVP